QPARNPEIGWRELRSHAPELVPAGPWFQWHFDSFTPPSGAVLLADNDIGAQAFVLGKSLGLQFHPEVTPDIVGRWARDYRSELDAAHIDPDVLAEETRLLSERARRAA